MDLQVTGTTTLKRGRWTSSSSVPPSLNQISPRVQLTQTPTSYILTVHLAGFKRDEIRLQMGKTKTIMVKAQRHVDGVGEVNWTWHIMDSDKSSSTPSKKPFQIPAIVDASKMSATFQDGVLTIVMPLIEDKKEAPPSPLPSEPAPISEDQQQKKTLDKDLGSASGAVHDGDGEEKKQGLADGQERNKEIEERQPQSTLSEKEKEEENPGSSSSKDEFLNSSSSVLHGDVEKSKQGLADGQERNKELSNQKEEKEHIKDLDEQDNAQDGAANTERDVENRKECIEDEEGTKEEKEDTEDRENAKYGAAANENAHTESPKEEKEDIQHMEKQESTEENANTESEFEENKAKVLCEEEKQKQLCDEEKPENEHNAFVEGKEASLASSRMAMAEDRKGIMEKCKSDCRTPEDRTSFDFKGKEHLSLERIREEISKNTRALAMFGTIIIVGILGACHRKLRRR